MPKAIASPRRQPLTTPTSSTIKTNRSRARSPFPRVQSTTTRPLPMACPRSPTEKARASETQCNSQANSYVRLQERCDIRRFTSHAMLHALSVARHALHKANARGSNHPPKGVHSYKASGFPHCDSRTAIPALRFPQMPAALSAYACDLASAAPTGKATHTNQDGNLTPIEQ